MTLTPKWVCVLINMRKGEIRSAHTENIIVLYRLSLFFLYGRLKIHWLAETRVGMNLADTLMVFEHVCCGSYNQHL